MTARLVVREKRLDHGIVVLDGQCTDPTGRVFATAILEVLAPTTRQRHEVAEHRLEGLVERCQGLKPMVTGVVHHAAPMRSAFTTLVAREARADELGQQIDPLEPPGRRRGC